MEGTGTVGRNIEIKVTSACEDLSTMAGTKSATDGGGGAVQKKEGTNAGKQTKNLVAVHNLASAEVIPWLWMGAARGPLVICGVFRGNAMLLLAQQAADAINSDRIYGVRPGSILSTMTTISGLFDLCIIPFLGTWIDYSSYRREVFVLSIAIMGFFVLMQGVLLLVAASSTWSIVLFLSIPLASCFQISSLCTIAFLPELSDEAEQRAQISAKGVFTLHGSQIVFAIIITVASVIFQMTKVHQAVLATLACSVVTICCGLKGGRGLHPREAAMLIIPAEGEGGATDRKVNCCFVVKKLFKTIWDMKADFPEIFHFLCGFTFMISAVTNMIVLSTTFLTLQLEMSGAYISILFTIALITGIPGAILSAHLAEKIGIYKVFLSIIACWIMTLIPAGLVLRTADDQWLVYIFGILWGVLFGGTFSMSRTVFTNMVPGLRESEFAGIYSMTGLLLFWAPSLGFTILFESTGSMTSSFMVLPLFHSIGFIILYPLPYEKALERVKLSVLKRRESRSESLLRRIQRENDQNQQKTTTP